MASSPSPSENQLIPRSEVDSQFSSLVFEVRIVNPGSNLALGHHDLVIGNLVNVSTRPMGKRKGLYDETPLKSLISCLPHLIGFVAPFVLCEELASFTDLSQQVQAAMENMLKMITEIDENSAGIMEDIEKCKDNALERKRTLEEQKESFQKAAFSVLDMLNKKDIGYN